MNKYLYLILLLLLYIYYFITRDYLGTSISIFILVLLRVILNYGNSINILNLIQLHSSIVYLIAPSAGYLFYDSENQISYLWKAFMPINDFDYFSYMVPALIAFFTGMEIFHSKEIDSKITTCMSRIYLQLIDKKRTGHYLVVFGIVSYYLALVVPQFLAFVFNIFFLFLFPGIFYLLFNRKKNSFDLFLIIFSISWIGLAAIKSTMFTIVMYMGITISGILLYNLKISFSKKVIITILSFYAILTIQYTKLELRNFKAIERSEISVTKFIGTFLKNTTVLKGNMNPNLFFPIYIRINQGRLTANVLKNIPSHKQYDNGERLISAIVSSVVPRLFWPNKPMAGGRFNMEYYADIKLDKSSMNVGPVGEAYGSFGSRGAFIYLFLFGSFISLSIRYYLKICIGSPLLILWLPVIFFQTVYCSETDSLQVFNSILKTAFLLYFVFKLFPKLIQSKI